MPYEYRYELAGTPMAACPVCHADLILPGAVRLTLCVCDHVFDTFTRLDTQGVLQDKDYAVANGYHSATTCTGCGALLADVGDEVDVGHGEDVA